MDKLVGIIGGTGLYQMEGVEDLREEEVETPFGQPSDQYTLGKLEGRPVAFLPRHGKGHRILPSEINYRANVYGFKKLGAEWIISVGAVGSMREGVRPKEVLIPDQFFDRTWRRVNTFFGQGIAAHVSLADPTCPELNEVLYQAGLKAGGAVHKGGTYLCIEGPQFSTRAESRIYRQWGVDVIGMTNFSEARLAREAEICYSTLAVVADYDVWHETEEDVSVELVVGALMQGIERSKRILREAILSLPPERQCICAQALKNTIITDPGTIPPEVKRDLHLLIGKYLPGKE